MSALISDVKTSVGNYKAELTTLSKQTLNVNRSICNLDDAIKSTQTSIETQELSIDSLEEFRLNCEDYFAEVDYTDSVAADAINQNKDDFYAQYYYLKPECEKSLDELAADLLASVISSAVSVCVSVGEWCKEKWESIVVKNAKIAWNGMMNTIKGIYNVCKEVANWLVIRLPLFIEDIKNFDLFNTDTRKVQNANFFSIYKGAFVIYAPTGSLDGCSFSLGVIVIDKGNRTLGDTDFANTVNHEWGHFIQLLEMGSFEYLLTAALPSMLHCNFGESKLFNDMGWNAYNSYYEKPYEYGADLIGGVTRTDQYTVDIHAGEWYKTYFDASIFERINYFFNPQKLFEDAAEENRYSYTREDYQYQKGY